MICPNCGFAFFPSEVSAEDKSIVACPKCSAMVDTKIVDVFDSSTRNYTSGVANVLKTIAYITWITGLIGVFLIILLSKGITSALLIDVLKYGYFVFVSGMIFYAFGEIVLLLTEIRNDQRKR